MYNPMLFSVLYLACNGVIAGTMGAECAAGAVTLPCVTKGFGIGAQALYLTADLPGLNFIGSSTTATLNASDEHFINKQFSGGPGFKLETFYRFETSKELNLNWYHYQHATRQVLPSPTNVYSTYFAGSVISDLKPLSRRPTICQP